MNTPRNTHWAKTWTFDAIQSFVDTAAKKDVAALKDSFEQQADFLRRHGNEGLAAFWEALASRIADAAERLNQLDPEDPSKRDAA